MELKFLEYPLGEAGFIHNWLVAGPSCAPLEPPAQKADENWKIQVSQLEHSTELTFSEPPCDRGYFQARGEKLRWRYTRCRDDHFVHLSRFCSQWTHLVSWALTQVKLRNACQATLTLTTFGPADVWINGEHVLRHAAFASRQPQTVSFQAYLEAEINRIVLRFEQIAAGNCPYLLALRCADLPENDPRQVQVVIPTQVKRPARQIRLEKALENAYLEKAVTYKGNSFNLRWSDDMEERVIYVYQVQDSDANIYVEGKWESNPAEPLDIGHPARLWERPYRVVLQAPGVEYWEQNLRYERDIPLQVLDTPYSEKPYGSFEGRLFEALEYASRRETDLFGQIALMKLERFDQINPAVIQKAIQQVNQHEAGAELLLVGLLGMRYRWLNHPSFPEALKQPLEECLQASLSFPLGEDQSAGSYPLWLTARLLAAQLYPQEINASQTGMQIQSETEKNLLEWMLERGRQGFHWWNSCLAQERLTASLSHLVSLAQNPAVRDTAAVLMDKLFFEMAIHCFKGANGSSQGLALSEAMKSAQMQATAGLQRVLWGMGVFNYHTAGTVSLACSDYQFPLLIGRIASVLQEEEWTRERSLDGAKYEVNRVAYRTPDYLLASAQDYRPGEAGTAEHIWQATLGPDALVFVSHPASFGEHEALKPGFWRGNAVLPRVAQWKDALIAIHKLPADDWLGFTHAFFPTFCFDEHELANNWAFARKGDGYLALTAARGLILVKQAPDAYRELRSYGQDNIWVCMMGRRAQDGSFDKFKRKVMEMKLHWLDEGIKLTTLRGDTLEFGWQGPFKVNGQEQSLKGFPHYDSPYSTADLPAEMIDITDGENILRLNFTEG